MVFCVRKSRHYVIAWLTLKSDYFGFKNDSHAANIYVVAQVSVHMIEDVFALLYENVAHIPSHANVLLCSDYDAHTNTHYHIENRIGSDGNLVNLLPEDVLKSSDDFCKLYTTGRLIRYSKDTRPADT